ncbi:TIR domain-containing protein [Hymenobacter defluvii]|uniref:TIR domain-containing protein n=1 Tax=Hymenobacter defluvii TaxID=2054411 RepID=A0ABS3THL8_9BACT|nr:TIR domain-containing protein [Hymenobacter defluvii]MBO3273142.1 TIR domain-containing protein [Hymenobacter defluvii]
MMDLSDSLAFYLRSNLRGHDFFISYSRADATAYALALAHRLDKENLTCYIDQWGALPGEKVPLTLLRKLTHCQVLLIIGSPRGLASEPMRTEIGLFAQTGRPIVPIAFGNVQQAVWSKEILGLAVTVETIESLNGAQPSEPLVARAKSSLTYTRQDKRIKRAIWTTSGLVLTLGLLIAYVSFNLKDTLRQVEKGKIQIDTIQKKRAQAEKLRERAVRDLNWTTRERDSAAAELLIATQQVTYTRATLSHTQDSLGVTTRKLQAERKNLVATQKQRDHYLATAYKRAAAATEMLATIEKGLGGLYQQPALGQCLLENVAIRPLVIYMYSDKYSLDPVGRARLDTLAACLKENLAYSVHISAHTANAWVHEGERLGSDDIGMPEKQLGTGEYSYVIGNNMASAVQNYLKTKGVSVGRMVSISYGNSKPLYSLELLNNRVEVRLVHEKP